jgi:hypothetical protein
MLLLLFERGFNLNDLAVRLKTVTDDLTTLKIPVPSGWMTLDAYQPRPRQFAPSDLEMGSNITGPPFPLKTAGNKD